MGHQLKGLQHSSLEGRRKPLNNQHVHMTVQILTWSIERWCIKEAVVKAYRGALSMQDISIGPNYWIDGFSPSQSYGLGTHNSYSPIAVVEPPRRPLLIPKELAKQRGLFCGTDTFILAPSEGKKLLKMSQWTVSGEFIDGKFRLSRSDVGQQYYPRRLKRANDNEGREIAKVSLSHDLHFATATCIASETERSYRSETQRRRFMTSSEAFYLDAVLDDGLGEPMHEPRWGDEGWVTPLMHEQYSWKVGRF